MKLFASSLFIVGFCAVVDVIDAKDANDSNDVKNNVKNNLERNVIKEVGDSVARASSGEITLMAIGADMKPLKKKLKV